MDMVLITSASPVCSVCKVKALSSWLICSIYFFLPPRWQEDACTSNQHFGQCCEEIYFHSVNEFDNFIVSWLTRSEQLMTYKFALFICIH